MKEKRKNQNNPKYKIKFLKSIKNTNIILSFLGMIIGILFIYNIIFTLENGFLKKDYITIFKWSLVVMKNDDMNDLLKKNDLVILKKSQYNNLQINTIIGYDKNNEIVFTKIKDKYNDKSSGKLTYVCQIDGTFYPSNQSIEGFSSYWLYIGKVKYIGILIKIIQSKMFSIIVVIALVILMKYNKYSYRQRKIRKKKKIIMN